MMKQATFIIYREPKWGKQATWTTFDKDVSEAEIAAMERRNHDQKRID